MEVFVARTEQEIAEAYDRLSAATVLGCDTETSGLSPAFGKLLSLQFSEGEFNVLLPISEGVALGQLADILNDPGIVKIFHNAKFDLEFLNDAGIATANIYDTMIGEKVLTKGANQSASLADTLYRYFAVDLDKAPRSKFNRNWDGVWTDELVHYALADVVHLPALMREQQVWLRKLGLEREFERQMAKVTVLQ
ncbi:MAG: hypothetical protein H0V76_08385 [Blastocatellia bacterium]|nr:hypothetical protein [Blastocatellia bacterium]